MSKIFSVCCLCLISLCAWSQEEARTKLIGAEAGIDGIFGPMQGDKYIRAETAYYSDEEKNVQTLTNKYYGGVKAEIRSRNNKFGFSGGLRLTWLKSSLGKTDYYESSGEFFYFMVEQTQSSIEYLKVKEINEASTFIGVPLAVSWSPFREKFLTWYFKGALELNYRLNTSIDAVFVNPSMNQYNDEVIDRLQESQKFNSLLGTYVGTQWGRNSKVVFRVEMGPSFFLNNNTSRLIDAIGAFGVQASLQYKL